MTLTEQVKQCKTPAEAILLLAQAIDELKETHTTPWDEPLDFSTIESAALTIEQTGDEETIVTFSAPSQEKHENRCSFARDELLLHEALPELGDEAIFAYAKGGPMWLYLGNRELFMSYSYHSRKMMVNDVLEDDPATAEEMGRDVLKHTEAEGVTEVLSRRGEA